MDAALLAWQQGTFFFGSAPGSGGEGGSGCTACDWSSITPITLAVCTAHFSASLIFSGYFLGTSSQTRHICSTPAFSALRWATHGLRRGVLTEDPHWANYIVLTFNQRRWRWLNVNETSCVGGFSHRGSDDLRRIREANIKEKSDFIGNNYVMGYREPICMLLYFKWKTLSMLIGTFSRHETLNQWWTNVKPAFIQRLVSAGTSLCLCCQTLIPTGGKWNRCVRGCDQLQHR